MTTRTDESASPLIESRDDLLSVFAGGEKAIEDWRIGTEHEKFVYRTADHRAPSYDEPGGIRDLLLGLTEYGWARVVENGNVIGVGGGGVGGQVGHAPALTVAYDAPAGMEVWATHSPFRDSSAVADARDPSSPSTRRAPMPMNRRNG